MRFSPHVSVRVDLARVRQNARALRERIPVPLLAVVKADAYGLGALEVGRAIRDEVDGFCFFSLHDAGATEIWNRCGKPIHLLGPPTSDNPDEYVELHARPAVIDSRQAATLKRAAPALCVDTGMHRLACPPEHVSAALSAGDCSAAFTHATEIEHVNRLIAATTNTSRRLTLHAAGTSLLNEPAAWLDAVRPGLALYRGAVRVSTRLVEVHHSAAPSGYTSFTSPTGCHGIILAGYSHGLHLGPCRINDRQAEILEVGMQTAFVSVDARDEPGDEVVLLGDGLEERQLAEAWNAPEQRVLVQLCSLGERHHVE